MKAGLSARPAFEIALRGCRRRSCSRAGSRPPDRWAVRRFGPCVRFGRQRSFALPRRNLTITMTIMQAACDQPQCRAKLTARPRDGVHHDPQPRPHPHHPCRQPAAQREAVRPADGAGGRQELSIRRCSPTRWTRRSATSSKAQMDAGIDVGNDGEQRRIGFQTYVPQRMSGFAGVSKRRRGLRVRGIPRAAGLSDAPLSQSAPRASRARRRRRPTSSISTSSRSPTRPRASTRSPMSSARSPSGS